MLMSGTAPNAARGGIDGIFKLTSGNYAVKRRHIAPRAGMSPELVGSPSHLLRTSYNDGGASNEIGLLSAPHSIAVTARIQLLAGYAASQPGHPSDVRNSQYSTASSRCTKNLATYEH